MTIKAITEDLEMPHKKPKVDNSPVIAVKTMACGLALALKVFLDLQ